MLRRSDRPLPKRSTRLVVNRKGLCVCVCVCVCAITSSLTVPYILSKCEYLQAQSRNVENTLTQPNEVQYSKQVVQDVFVAPGTPQPSLNRFEYMTAGLDDILAQKGLIMEISPLSSPLLPRDYAGYRSIDVTDRSGLINKYKDHDAVDKNMIQEPSYIWKGQRYRELVGEETKFQLIVAAHVLEHVPNLISFLNDAASILETDGELRLIFPDYRYCFDWSREPSRLADIVAAHVENRTRPTSADVYDYFALVHTGGVQNDPAKHWGTSERDFLQERVLTPSVEWHDLAMKQTMQSFTAYVDVHVWRFDSNTFYAYMSFLTKVGLVKLQLTNIVPAQTDNFEIFATFRKLS